MLSASDKKIKEIIACMNGFKSILLVDDNDATNFYHQIVIEEWGKTENVYIALNGSEALEFLRTHESFRFEHPSLILLDINMPVMNGFEFLEAYESLDDSLKATFVVVMLTSSLHPEDQERASHFPELRGYIHKPLTIEQLEGILNKIKETGQV